MPGADPYLSQSAAPDRRQAHRGIDRGGTLASRRRCRQATRAAAHLGRQRSDSTKLLYSYYLSESATPYPADKVRFGTHQLREKVDEDNLLYVTWFAGGLRIIDINDPASPKERGYFIPKPGDGVAAPLTNDVFKDDRGLLWVTDKERGLDVIEYKN